MGKILGYGEITVANIAEPFIVMLTNEAQQFATDSNRKVISAQSYYTDIIVIRGNQERTDYTIGNVTSANGINVSKSSKRVTFSVSAGTTIGADAGTITIPITLDGQTVNKQFSWSCGKQGIQGITGDKGKSIAKVIEYYLATSASTGVTTSTSGWSTDPASQKLTAEKKYLWNCKQTVYDDGTRGSITTPVICGTYGDKGNDGQTSYIHIAYANITFLCNENHSFTLTEESLLRYGKNGKWIYKTFSVGTYNATTGVFGGKDPASGLVKEVNKITDFSLINSEDRSYTGQYTDFTETASTDPSKYNWTKTTGDNGVSPKVSLSKSGNTTTISIVDATGTHTQTVKDGTNGTPGAAGKDGKTSYFHVKYSNDGGKTFTGNSGEDTGIYMGSYTDYTEVDSTDVGKYNWIKVSGDNFSWNLLTKDDCNMSKWTNTMTSWIKVTNNEYNNTISYTTLSGGWEIIYKKISVEKGKKYVLSFDYKVNKAYNYLRGQKYGVYISTSQPTNQDPNNIIENGQYIIENTVTDIKRGLIIFTAPADTLYIVINGGCIQDGQTGLSFEFNKWKLEEGEIASPWTPHKDDLEGRGVTQTVQYYLATSQASGVTSSTSGWSTDITAQKITATKKYLWNCYQTKYSDGTSEPISTPKIIGVYGDKGQKGDAGEDGAGFHWNLLNGTKDFDKTKMFIASATSFESKKYLNFTVVKAIAPTNGYIDLITWNNIITPSPSTDYTLSFYAKASIATTVRSHFYPSCTLKNISNGGISTNNDGSADTKITTEWARYSVQWRTLSSVSGVKNIIPIRIQHGLTADNATIYLCGVKFEQSDKASPWCTTQEESLAKSISVTPSSQIFKSTDGGKIFAPNKITITPTIQGDITFGKWQYSIDGGVSFTDVASGQKGLSISNNVLTVSKDSSLYSDSVTMVTFKAVANDSNFYDTCSIVKIYDVVDLGDGRNLLVNCSQYTKKSPLKKTGYRTDDYIEYKDIHTSINLEKDKNYVIQAKTDGKWVNRHTLGGDPNLKTVTLWLCGNHTDTYFDMTQGYAIFKPPVTGSYYIRINQYSDGKTPYTINLWDFKLEKGSYPTGYSPAPEDTKEKIANISNELIQTNKTINSVQSTVDKQAKEITNKVSQDVFNNSVQVINNKLADTNEGIGKWLVSAYQQQLFASEYRDKCVMEMFASNTDIVPYQTLLVDDTKLNAGTTFTNTNGACVFYALTFVYFSQASSLTTNITCNNKMNVYVNGTSVATANVATTTTLVMNFRTGWNVIEVLVNSSNNVCKYYFGQTISTVQQCKKMNCYAGTITGRDTTLFSKYAQMKIGLDSINSRVQSVETVSKNNGTQISTLKTNYSDLTQNINGFKTEVAKTYATQTGLNNAINNIDIGGNNLIRLGGLAKNTATDMSYDKTTDTYTIVSPVGSSSWGYGVCVLYDNNHQVLVPYGRRYILSFEIKVPQALSINIDVNCYATSGSNWSENDNDNVGQRKLSSYNIPANTWTRVWVSWENSNSNNTNKVDLFDNSAIGLVTSNCSSPVTWQIRRVKAELGNKPTDWSPCAKDTNESIQTTYTIAQQTADKFSWLVSSGTNASNFTLTDRTATLIAEKINLNGLVTFNGLNASTRQMINDTANNANTAKNLATTANNWVTSNGTNMTNMLSMVRHWTDNAISDSTQINGGWIKTNTITADKIAIGDFTNYSDLSVASANTYGFTVVADSSVSDNPWFQLNTVKRDTALCPNGYTNYRCNGGTFYVRYQMSSTVKDSNGNYVNVNIGLYGKKSDGSLFWSFYDKGHDANGNASGTVKTLEGTVTLPADAMCFSVFLQLNAIDFGSGTVKIRNVEVTKMQSGELIVDGSILANKINVDDLFAQNISAKGTISGVTLKGATGSFSGSIYASGGTIAGWNITDGKLYNGSGSSYAGLGKEGSAWAFWAGAPSPDNSDGAKFRVGHDGSLLATNANITGNITATSGTFTGTVNATDGVFQNIRLASGSVAGWGVSGNNLNSSISYTDSSGYDTCKKVWIDSSEPAINTYFQGIPNHRTERPIKTNTKISPSEIVFHTQYYEPRDYHCNGKYSTYEITIGGGDIWIDDGSTSTYINSGGVVAPTIEAEKDIKAQSWVYAGESGRFTFTNRTDNYITTNWANNTLNTYYYAPGYHAFYVGGNGIAYVQPDGMSLTDHNLKFTGEHGVYSNTMNEYMIRYFIASGTKCTAVGNSKYPTRIYGTSVWSSKSISTSDIKLKKNFHNLDKYEKMFMSLEPVDYRWRKNYEENDNKIHFGLKAQQVEDAFNNAGFDIKKYAIVEDYGSQKGLCYNDFIPLTMHMTQKNKREIDELKKENKKLKQLLEKVLQQLSN